MAAIENSLFDIRYMDALASGNSLLHKIDPRAKLITTIFFICMVVSFGKYEISRMIPFVIFPLAMVILADLPFLYLVKKILIVSPFAILVGMFNPFMDTQPLVQIGSLSISGGWISFFSILIRFVLTVSAALILICLTGFNGVCLALEKLKVPRPFVIQLLFLYRYLYVLADEASRMIRARSLRSFNSGKLRFNVFINLLGQLLLRTMDRAQRIHRAMCCRGFDGHIHVNNTAVFGYREIRFVLFWLFLFIFARYNNLPVKLGSLITEYFI